MMEDKQQFYHEEIIERVEFNIDNFKEGDCILGCWKDTNMYNFGGACALYFHSGELHPAKIGEKLSDAPYFWWSHPPITMRWCHNPYYKK